MFLVAIGALLLSLDLKIVKVSKNSNIIKTQSFSMLGLSLKRKTIEISEGDRLSIFEEGQSRFTNTNYYYSVRVVNRKSQKSEHVIRKACIFDARTTIIELAYQLNIPFSTKINKRT